MTRIRSSSSSTISLRTVILALTVLLSCTSNAMAVQNTLEGSKVVEYLRRLDDADTTTTTSTTVPPPKKAPKPKKKPSNSDPAPSTTETVTTSSSTSNTPASDTTSNNVNVAPSTPANNKPDEHPGAKPMLFLLGSAAAGTLAVAAAASRKKRRVEPKAHPLAGSVGRRMQMFHNLADKSNTTAGSGGKGRGVLDGDVRESEMTGYRRAEGESMGIAVV